MKTTFITIAAGAGAITAIVAAYYAVKPIAQSVILEGSDPPPLAAASRVEALESVIPPMQSVLQSVQATLIEGEIDTVQRRIDCSPVDTDQSDRVDRIQELQRRHVDAVGYEYDVISGDC